MSHITVYLDNLNKEQQRICEGCSARGQTYAGQIPFPLCKLAELEKSLDRKPKYGETTRDHIDTNSIPEGCPNGYISLPSREVR